ncbi:MAG: hypothetical protein M5U01_32600 [Ardenticatenaceae bacterium]|nr:hypothetical protein [Ardenticatenaceae bacterium]
MTPTPAPATPPSFRYLHAGTLIEQTPERAPQALATVPDPDAVLDATQVNHFVVLLRRQALDRLDVRDGSSAPVARFDSPARFGALLKTPTGDPILYWVTFDDPGAPFGLGTLVGSYQVARQIARPIIIVHRSAQPLGLSADGKSLHLLPWGQDPAFGHVLVVDLARGQIEAELPVAGEIFAALSPDGRALVTTARRRRGETLETVLNFYELTSATPALQVLDPPRKPSHAWGLLWAPDSRGVYFLLRPGDLYDEPVTADGLRRLDGHSKAMAPVAAIGQAASRPLAISADGQWLLLRPDRGDVATLVHLPTGAVEVVPLPATAVFVGSSLVPSPRSGR